MCVAQAWVACVVRCGSIPKRGAQGLHWLDRQQRWAFAFSGLSTTFRCVLKVSIMLVESGSCEMTSMNGTPCMSPSAPSPTRHGSRDKDTMCSQECQCCKVAIFQCHLALPHVHGCKVFSAYVHLQPSIPKLGLLHVWFAVMPKTRWV